MKQCEHPSGCPNDAWPGLTLCHVHKALKEADFAGHSRARAEMRKVLAARVKDCQERAVQNHARENFQASAVWMGRKTEAQAIARDFGIDPHSLEVPDA